MTTSRTLGEAWSAGQRGFPNPQLVATVEALTDSDGKQDNTIAERRKCSKESHST